MPKKEIRIGIVGAGANTVARHIPGFQAIDGVKLISLCNRSRQSSQRVAEQFAIPTIYENWQQLVAAPDTDAILIGTWPYLHCPATLAALEADKHVLCEARMAANAAEARQMRDAACAKPHLITQVVPSPMTLAVDATIKRLIGEGYLGQILAVEIRDCSGFIDPDAPLHWRENIEFSGLNIMSLGIWYEAVMRWIGPATRVLAQARTFVETRTDSTGRPHAVGIPDHLDIIAEMACGAQTHMQISRVTGLAGDSEVFIFGSQATLRFSGGQLYGGCRADSALKPISIPPDQQGRWRVETEFINAIRGIEPVTHTTFDDGVRYMNFTEAVSDSIASGRAVPLPG